MFTLTLLTPSNKQESLRVGRPGPVHEHEHTASY